jgi:putative ABC transport system permease protein
MSTRRTEQDFADEIDAHLALEIERLIGDGLTPEQARLAARRQFGSVLAARERFHESRRVPRLDHLLQDLRYGARRLRTYPVAAAVAVVSLAFGIGATTATITVRDVIFRKPPPLYRNPSQLSRVQVASPLHPLRPDSLAPGALFAHWREAALGATLAAATPTRVREYRSDDRSDTIRVRAATSEFFSVLGVDAAIGRASLSPDTIVLSDRLWRKIFDGRSDIVGRQIWIDNKTYIVAGVMPERFWFSTTDSAAWTLLDPGAAAAERVLDIVGRRQANVTHSMLAAQLENGLNAYARSLPIGERELRVAVSGIEGTPIGRAVAVALPWMLAAAVLLTLLIACANVAILVIAQWTAREHEIAIRASLGASRGRVVRALVAESLVIAVIGGALGICVTFALIGIIVRNGGSDVRFLDLSIEPHVLIESMLMTLVTGLVSGIGPALLETRRLHGNPMRTLATSDRIRQQWRHGLVVLEIAVTVALLVVTGGMLNTYQRQLSRDVGFNTHPLVALRVENTGGVPVRRIVDAIAQMPDVAAAAAASSVPYMGSGPLDPVSTDATGTRTVRAERVSIDSSFFATIAVPMRAGRGFTSADAPSTATAIVNERAAASLFPGVSAIGREIWLRGKSYEIVGIAGQYVNQALQPPDLDAKVFLPLDPSSAAMKQHTFIVRAARDPVATSRALRPVVRSAAAGNVVSSLYTLEEVISVGGQEILVGTAPLAPLIATGMLLTAAGIYGVLAFAIARRSKELALRVAIGAQGGDVVRLVVRHSARLVVLGVAIGIGVTFALSRIVRASGGGGSFLDPRWPAFVIPVGIIVAIAALATFVPSRRALRINPAILLRAQ